MPDQPERYPGARWRPLGRQTQPRMGRHDIICLHTMVGSLAGTEAMFLADGYTGTESHFGLGGSGELVQWQDLRHTADANYQGSERVISIETADHGPEFDPWTGSDVPAWTPQQVTALIGLIAWLANRYDIPLILIPDTRAGRRGVGYHRQGVDPWRHPLGERWSTKHGKVCPGDRRVAQIPGIIQAAANVNRPGGPVSDKLADKIDALDRDLRAMWEGMGRGDLDRLDFDLRADLAVKAETLAALQSAVGDQSRRLDQLAASVDQLATALTRLAQILNPGGQP